jgi:hypothetical protein
MAELSMNALRSEKELKALVDRLLLEQGRLDPLELLLAANLLDYQDYEAWRMGRKPDIQNALPGSPADVAELLEQAASYAAGQRLSATPLEHRGWGSHDASLRIGSHARLVRACGSSYAPPAHRPQLDLFQDSTALVLEEEIRRALVERRTDRAREQAAQLLRENPRHRHLQGFLRLIEVADDSDIESPKERLVELLAIEPLARELLGHRDRDFLAPHWSAIAESLAGRPFEAAEPQLHASFAWARAGHWGAARRAVETESDWLGEPALLLAHAEACRRQGDRAAALHGWMWLCWEHPLEAERAFASPGFPDSGLAEHWTDFGDLDPPLDTEDFPAWLLLREPSTAALVTPDSMAADERHAAYGLLHRLVTGEDDIELRRQLSEIHPRLLCFFLARRG